MEKKLLVHKELRLYFFWMYQHTMQTTYNIKEAENFGKEILGSKIA